MTDIYPPAVTISADSRVRIASVVPAGGDARNVQIQIRLETRKPRSGEWLPEGGSVSFPLVCATDVREAITKVAEHTFEHLAWGASASARGDAA